MRYADLVYVISHDIRNHIITDFHIPVEKIQYLPFGIDTNTFIPKPGKKTAGTKTIEIFSNRGFFPVYDSETLVNGFALAYQKDQRLRLTLKGEGPDEQKIRDLVTSLGISEIVTFRKKSLYSEVPNDYRNCRYLCHHLTI